ncbi:MAG: hypothetical protein PWQ44_2259 [Methanolobus sp.]|jgi:hypothetical protein|nr:hypothetical protein [Methanolobus sp.]
MPITFNGNESKFKIFMFIHSDFMNQYYIFILVIIICMFIYCMIEQGRISIKSYHIVPPSKYDSIGHFNTDLALPIHFSDIVLYFLKLGFVRIPDCFRTNIYGYTLSVIVFQLASVLC